MTKSDCTHLVQLLLEAKQLVSRKDNDFMYSSWMDVSDANKEIDALIVALKSMQLPRLEDISTLFAPTGPLQELAMESGWTNEFSKLATNIDVVLSTLYPDYSVIDEDEEDPQ